MAIDTLKIVLDQLFEIYGLWCSVKSISDYTIVMGNGHVWTFNDEGFIFRQSEDEKE